MQRKLKKAMISKGKIKKYQLMPNDAPRNLERKQTIKINKSANPNSKMVMIYFRISVSSVYNLWLKFFSAFTDFRRRRSRQLVSTS